MSDEHVPDEQLAELDEELLPAIRADQVRDHLAECTACGDRLAGIVAVRRRLANVPPVSMPAGVSDRITGRLRAAAASSGADDTPAPGREDTTVVPLQAPPGRRRRQAPALAGVAATIVVLAAIAAVVVGHIRHNPSSSHGHPAASGAADRPLVDIAPHQFTVHTTGRNYTPSSLPAAVPQLVTGGLPGATETASPPGPSAVPSGSGGSGAAAGGTSTSGNDSLAEHSARLPAASPLAVPAALRHLYQSRPALLSCAAKVSDTPGAVPLTVDFARWTNGQYHSAPSVIFVFQQPPSSAVVIVTGPTCAGLDAIRDYHIVPLS